MGSGDEADGGTESDGASVAKAQESVVGEAAALRLLEFGSLPVNLVDANGNIPCMLVLHLY